jgi:hypothetical protein
MEVLVALARANGAVVSREALIESCWGGRTVSDDAIERGEPICDRGLDELERGAADECGDLLAPN